MKKAVTLILISLIYTASVAMAQEKEVKPENGKAGITFSSFGSNNVFYFKQLTGAASYNSDRFYTLGVSYLYPLSGKFDLETGIEYSHHKIIIQPNLPPDMDDSPYGAEFSLINIPLSVRANLGRYFYLNGGLFLGINPTVSGPIDSQTGIGAQLGFGLKYDSKSGISVFANPYLKTHALVSFSAERYHQHLMETGFRFGILYKLN